MCVRLFIAVAVLASLAGISVGARGAAADPAVSGYPGSVAVLGDSITRAVDSDALGDRPENSWATGTNATVDSYYSRLLAEHPPISGNRYNDAVSGAQMEDLDGQAQDAVAQGAELVFVFMGANDVCTSSEASMTPVNTFQTQFETAMETLSSGLPDARIGVVSIPDIYNLWEILKDDPNARFIWSFASICQSLLEDPLSEDPADVQRRANVRQRNMDFNDVLHDVCGEYVHCRFDDYTGFNTAFTPGDVSSIDYFHPSVAGQALIAQLAWENFYDWSDDTPPVSGSAGAEQGGGFQVVLSASDDVAVSGIEYQSPGGWVAYDSPLSLSAGDEFTWRAVDVNGNVEASHTCKVIGWAWGTEDVDCDGFSATDEGSIGTDPDERCGAGAWPPDFNDSQIVDQTDVLTLKPIFFTAAPPSPARLDIAPSGFIDQTDVLALKPFFFLGCT